MPAYPISRIALEGAEFDRFSINPQNEELGKKYLPHLSRVNLFVGANNSGKSRFLRSLACIRDPKFFGPPNIDTPEKVLKKLKKRLNHHKHIFEQNRQAAAVMNLMAEREDHSIWLAAGKNPADGISELIRSLSTCNVGQNLLQAFSYEDDLPDDSIKISSKGFLEGISSSAADHLVKISENFTFPFEFERFYIPTLRGLRQLDDQPQPDSSTRQPVDLYFRRTASDYFGGGQAPEIVTGQDLHKQLKDHLLGNLQQREFIAEFQIFLGDMFFQGAPVVLIPKESDNNVYVKIGDEKEFAIHNLGDGVQSIILHTFPLFQRQHSDNYVFVFMEEPELYMHPGLQRIFLETLLDDRFDQFRFFIATHSNHLLDLTIDEQQISVYNFQKFFKKEETGAEQIPHFQVENVNNSDRRTLDLLGVRNSSIFFSNCTIWVEGITDRRYIQHYLNLYLDKLKEEGQLRVDRPFKEDLHYSFVEYGGGNITHWSFLDKECDAIDVKRLCAKLFLVADKDSASSKEKRARHEALEENLGERFHVLPVREIENLLTPAVLRSVLIAYGEQDGALKRVSASTYSQKPLGRFIAEKIIIGDRLRKGDYAAKSGTVTRKKDFCAKAISSTKSYDDLSNPAKVLTEKVYAFIADSNPEDTKRAAVP